MLTFQVLWIISCILIPIIDYLQWLLLQLQMHVYTFNGSTSSVADEGIGMKGIKGFSS